MIAKTDKTEIWKNWHIKLSDDRRIFSKALKELQSLADGKNDIPWIVQVFENPKYNIMPGSVSLVAHDMIHILLGRGLLPNDEAFTAGYAMGNSVRRPKLWHKVVFLLAQRFLYRGKYRFNNEQCKVFWNAIKIGEIMKNKNNFPIDLLRYEEDLEEVKNNSIKNVRRNLGIDVNILKKAYEWESKMFPNTKESIRNL